MNLLKLIALDSDDLAIISAHVQDAVTKVGDIGFKPAEKRFVLPMNRFVWEAETARFTKPHNERRNSVLDFSRVLSVKASGIDRNKKQDVLSLLAIQFEEGDKPAGHVDLLFSGGSAIRLEVECVEARLADLGGAWEAASRPDHKV
jgi:hypothetical protein